ncbi:hypothetical protein BC826DRAFT_1119604 [Russula brevipes]|nr:hypothetical protein BC826DRAFT_1119604 [Russula brevipes]
MLQILPVEISIAVLSYLPIPSLCSLPAVSREWSHFFSVNRSTIFHNAAVLHEYTEPGTLLLEDALSVYSGSPWEGAADWRDFCRPQILQLRNNWEGNGRVVARLVTPPGGDVHRIKVDEKAGLCITTRMLGGLSVIHLFSSALLWSLPPVSESFNPPRHTLSLDAQTTAMGVSSTTSVSPRIASTKTDTSSSTASMERRRSGAWPATSPPERQPPIRRRTRGRGAPRRSPRRCTTDTHPRALPPLGEAVLPRTDARVPTRVPDARLREQGPRVSARRAHGRAGADDRHQPPVHLLRRRERAARIRVRSPRGARVFAGRQRGGAPDTERPLRPTCRFDVPPRTRRSVRRGLPLLAGSDDFHPNFLAGVPAPYPFSTTLDPQQCFIYFCFFIAHVSRDGRDLVILAARSRVLLVRDFERICRGEISLEDAGQVLRLLPRDICFYLAFEHGRICVATFRGLYIFTVDRGPSIESVKVVFVHPFRDIEPTLQHGISCMQLTDRRVYFTWEDSRRRDLPLFRDEANASALEPSSPGVPMVEPLHEPWVDLVFDPPDGISVGCIDFSLLPES